jgi:hypothetical protein
VAVLPSPLLTSVSPVGTVPDQPKVVMATLTTETVKDPCVPSMNVAVLDEVYVGPFPATVTIPELMTSEEMPFLDWQDERRCAGAKLVNSFTEEAVPLFAV